LCKKVVAVATKARDNELSLEEMTEEPLPLLMPVFGSLMSALIISIPSQQFCECIKLKGDW
jgi:hypothetical protein